MKKRSCEFIALTHLDKKKAKERYLADKKKKKKISSRSSCLFILFNTMKFRLKTNSQNYSITADDINDELTIFELKNKIKKRFLSLRK
jgi:hypothetical protein